MSLNRIRDLLESGKPSFGAIVTMPSPQVVQVRNIGAIVEAKGVDVAIIGPGDLATSMGFYGQVEHPDVQAAMLEAEKIIKKSSMALGGVAFSPEHANRMIVPNSNVEGRRSQHPRPPTIDNTYSSLIINV